MPSLFDDLPVGKIMVTYHRIILPLAVDGVVLIGIAINMLKLK